MEYCPYGWVDKVVVNRKVSPIEEKEKRNYFKCFKIVCKANFSSDEQFTK